MNTFAPTLAAAREKRRLSKRALADRIGVQWTAVTHWERGHTIPQVRHVFALERALQLAAGTLARHLGYGPPIDPDSPPGPPSVDRAIRGDDSLSEHRQDLLIELYSQLRSPPPAPQNGHRPPQT
jgi:transcriptional regulator with XRE-family HTH domain